MKSLFCLFALAAPSFGAVSISLPGISENAVWNGLSSANHTPNATTTNPWGPVAATGANVTLSKLSGPGYFYGSGIYGWHTGPSTYSVDGVSSLTDVATVVFQARLGAAPTQLTLSYNGGSQQLIADLTQKVLFGSGSGPSPTTIDDYAWQWDLSGITEEITSYSITMTVPSSTVIYSSSPLQIDAGDTFVAVVPEPSSMLLGVAALALTVTRRRRA